MLKKLHKHASFEVDSTTHQVILKGAWSTRYLENIASKLRKMDKFDRTTNTINAAKLTHFDTAGALLLLRLKYMMEHQYNNIKIIGLKTENAKLLDLVSAHNHAAITSPRRKNFVFLNRLGQNTWRHLDQIWAMLAFVGEVTIALLINLVHPLKIRWRILVHVIEDAGVNAIPILGLLSFLLGIVIGYQGGAQLKLYGANIYVVEMVALTILRELAPMMAAIIVAGRTGSAFTAQIGTMNVTQEIDALRTIGISPLHVLVVPRVLALLVTLPLLTVFADAMGLFGGMVMAWAVLDVSLIEFWNRLPEAVPISTLLLGIGKAPVFALIVAMVGCFQGFRVTGGGESVGLHTTKSVVQAIFLIIVTDALFSIVFSWFGI